VTPEEKALVEEYTKLLTEFGDRHADVLKQQAEHSSIIDRIADLDGGPDRGTRQEERRRAFDKLKIVRTRVEDAKAERDKVHVKLEALRFRAQIQMDLTLAPAVLPVLA
jgi:hypothetical protein